MFSLVDQLNMLISPQSDLWGSDPARSDLSSVHSDDYSSDFYICPQGRADLRIAHVSAGSLSLKTQPERGMSVPTADCTAALPVIRLIRLKQHFSYLKQSLYHYVLLQQEHCCLLTLISSNTCFIFFIPASNLISNLILTHEKCTLGHVWSSPPILKNVFYLQLLH